MKQKPGKSGKTSVVLSGPGPRRRFIWALCTAGALALLLAAGYVWLDIPPTVTYTIVPGDGQALYVSMDIRAPLFCRQSTLTLYTGDGDVQIRDYDGPRTLLPAPTDENLITVYLSRARTTTLRYHVTLGKSGKHGYRGRRTDTLIAFDGGQAFLLPASFYSGDEEGISRSMQSLRFRFSMPPDWQSVIPYNTLDRPTWSSLNALQNDAFVFSASLTPVLDTGDGLRVMQAYGLPMADGAANFSALYLYLGSLFQQSPRHTIVLLPPEGDGLPIMGGAGRETSAYTFDDSLLRDWQLMAHRLFHAFFDTVKTDPAYLSPPNLWMVEGLAVQYETRALEHLSPETTARLGVDARAQTAMLFARYVYMRLKDPFRYLWAPMDEASVSGSPGRTEFLHYTAAPVVIQAMEDAAALQGHPADALLRFILNEKNPEPDRPLALAVSTTLLGDDAEAFSRRFLLSDEIPNLWHLANSMPDDGTTARLLNDMEQLMASWFTLEEDDYRADMISDWEQVLARNPSGAAVFLSADMADTIVSYSPVLYAFLSDYYGRARNAGLSPDDPALRNKLAAG